MDMSIDNTKQCANRQTTPCPDALNQQEHIPLDGRDPDEGKVPNGAE